VCRAVIGQCARRPAQAGTAPTTTATGYIERCGFARHAPIIPPWTSIASGSGADRVLGGLISEYERAASTAGQRP
jgi:hypothetical protein